MDIWSMTRPALEDWFSSRGENPAKAAILLERLYQRGLRDFSELPFAQRVISALSEEFTMELPETVARSGDDSTEKLLLEYPELFNTPIVRNGKEATVGYCPDVWAKWE